MSKAIEQANGEIVKKIRQLIDEKGLKHVTVANQVGMTPYELSSVFNGRRIIKASEIEQLLNVLDSNFLDIYKDRKEYHVVNAEGELIASISHDNVIETEGYKVICAPNS